MKNTKKLWLIIAVIALIGFVVTTLSLTGCDNGNGACTHTGGAAATCTTAQTCTKCSDVMQAALGHQTIWSTYSTTTGHVGCNRSGCTGGLAKLGDTGPAGGKIIYVAPTVDGFEVTSTTAAFTTYIAYYLEAAPANAVGGTGAQTTMRWSTRSSSPYLDVTGTEEGLFSDRNNIGLGRNNTALIIAAEKEAYPSDTYIYAALACDNYSVEGFNDWFLPSRDELDQLYIRRADFGLSSGFFWSSSQNLDWSAWSRNFGDGIRYSRSKDNDENVRPVRAF